MFHFQLSRPVPNLPPRAETPEEFRENGNPQLDSDSNTIDTQSNITDEGVKPLLQQPAEMNDQFKTLADLLQKAKFVENQTVHPHLNGNGILPNVGIPQKGAVLNNMDSNGLPAANNGSVNPSQAKPTQNHAMLQNGAITNSHKHDGLDFRENDSVDMLRRGLDFEVEEEEEEEEEPQGAWQEEGEVDEEEEEGDEGEEEVEEDYEEEEEKV